MKSGKPTGIDKGSCFGYWKLSYRRKFIRTLWFTLLIVVLLLTPSEIPVIGTHKLYWFAALIVIAPTQLLYNYYKWQTEEASTEMEDNSMDAKSTGLDNHNGYIPPAGKPPWNPNDFVWLSILFSFGASGILAGLNWRRLGQSQRAWPTAIMSVVALAVVVCVAMVFPDTTILPRALVYGINIGVAMLLARWQAPAYKEWTSVYGEPTRRQSGCLLPTAIGLCITIAVFAIAISFTFVLDLVSVEGRADRHFYQGLEYQEQGQLDLAVNEYSQAIDLYPEFAAAYVNRGNIYLERGDFAGAIENYDEAIELDPVNYQAFCNRASARLYMGEYELGLHDLDEAIRLEPEQSFAYFLRGLAYADLWEDDLAVADLQLALDIGLPADYQQIAEQFLEELGE